MKSSKTQIILLTGYSGSGKSSGLRILENLGYYCVDNLPARLLKNFIEMVSEKKSQRRSSSAPELTNSKVAVVVDARGINDMHQLEKDLETIAKKIDLKIIFFAADLETITNRYKALRLRHPLALKGTIQDGYRAESRILAPLRHRANLVIDTNQLNVHSLRALIDKYVHPKKNREFQIYLQSFGYKNGLPPESDLIIDVRCLINPFFEPALKRKTGKTKSVQNYIFDRPESRIFLRKTLHYLNYLLKRYEEDGKNFLHVAFGCTGGKHRSVAIIEVIRPLLQRKNKRFTIVHRDLHLE